MNRKEYIDALDGVYKRVKELRDAFGLIRLTDAEPMEDDRRKKTAKMIDDLADRLYEDGAISSRIAADNAAAGKGEQDDLFDDAARKAAKKAAKKKTDAEVVEVQPLALPEPKCVHFDETKNGCGHKDADCAECANCDGKRRECAHFSLGEETIGGIPKSAFDEAKADIERRKKSVKKSGTSKKPGKGKKKGGK